MSLADKILGRRDPRLSSLMCPLTSSREGDDISADLAKGCESAIDGLESFR